MGFHSEPDYGDKEQQFSDYGHEEDIKSLNHRKKVKRLLENCLEKRRLKTQVFRSSKIKVPSNIPYSQSLSNVHSYTLTSRNYQHQLLSDKSRC